MFCRMNDTPMAVMRGASRGACRSGRYANRSMTTPTTPMISIVTTNTSRSTPASSMGLPTGPLKPSLMINEYATNDPIMKTSP